MKEFLQSLRRTLSLIEVRGQENLNYLLGSILAVDQMLAQLDAAENPEKEDDHGG